MNHIYIYIKISISTESNKIVSIISTFCNLLKIHLYSFNQRVEKIVNLLPNELRSSVDSSLLIAVVETTNIKFRTIIGNHGMDLDSGSIESLGHCLCLNKR